MKTRANTDTPQQESGSFRAATVGILLTGLLLLCAVGTSSVPAVASDAGGKAPTVSAPVSGGDVTYIVVYRDGVSLSSRLQAEEDLGIEVDRTYRNVFKGFAAQLVHQDVERLRRDPRVEIVEPDRQVTIQSNAPQDRSTPSWGLDRIDQRALPLNSRIASASNGFGVEAYVIDTGVRLDHTQFSGRMNSEGFSAFPGGWNDCEGHGTHVAGTVAGSSYGVAPAARVTAVRVLDCSGSGSYSSVIAGIDWMIADHQAGQPAVGNMSLGGPRSETLNTAIDRAVADGITMAVAAGNDSSNACAVSPASAPAAVTVGSTARTDAMSSFSNTGQCVDIFAPGSEIPSASFTSPNAVETLSGTSMASPHVAGAAALLLSSQPTMSPAAVADQLVATSTPGAISSLEGCTLNRLLHIGSSPNLPGPGLPPRPGHDDWINAEPLSTLSGTNGTSNCATRESGEPSHGTASGASVWYRWTAPSNGTLTLTTSGSSFDTLLAVYTGSSLASLSPRAQDDDSGSGVTSQVSLSVTAGVTYSIAIDGYGGASGDTRISGSLSNGGGGPGDPPDPERPLNDDFFDRQDLNLANSTTGSNSGATAESGEPGHAQAQAVASIWYRWTATSNGTLTLDASGSSFDTVLAVYSGSSVSSLIRLAQDDDSGDGLTSKVSLPVTSGNSYSIALDGFGGANGDTRILATISGGGGGGPGRPVNDDFVDAIRVNNWQSTINTSNVGATAEAGEPSHEAHSPGATAVASIWYRWTAPANGTLRIDTTSRWGKDIAVYSGSSLGAIERVGAGLRDVEVPVRRGEEYRIAFDSFSSTSTESITITGAFTQAARNDDFSDAERISSWNSTVTGTNVSATTEDGEPSHGDSPEEGPNASVWYEWTAPSNGLLTLDGAVGDSEYSEVAIYTGTSVSSLETVASDADGEAVAVRGGERYRIAVDSFSVRRTGTLTLTGEMVRAAPNDDFESAAELDLGTSVIDGSNSGSTIEEHEPVHLPNGEERQGSSGSIWYRWTAPQDMRVVFSSSEYPSIAVYTGSTLETLDRTPISGESWEARFEAEAGETYSIALEDDPQWSEPAELRFRRVLRMPRFKVKPPITTRSTTARFAFEGDRGAGFQCRLKGQQAWRNCARSITFRNLRPGEQVLRVRQQHGASVSPTNEWIWWIDR